MLPVSEAKFFFKKNNRFLIIRGYRIATEIDESSESDDGMFLPFFLSGLTYGVC